jgi:hypothetical protein
VAELIVEKSEEAIENDSNGFSENNSPSKLQLQLEDLKKINNSLKSQNTELMVLSCGYMHMNKHKKMCLFIYVFIHIHINIYTYDTYISIDIYMLNYI